MTTEVQITPIPESARVCLDWVRRNIPRPVDPTYVQGFGIGWVAMDSAGNPTTYGLGWLTNPYQKTEEYSYDSWIALANWWSKQDNPRCIDLVWTFSPKRDY